MKAAALLLAAACGSVGPRECMPNDECAPNAQCIETSHGWTVCICCSLTAADAGYAVLFYPSRDDAAQCAVTAAGWRSLCP